MLYISVCIYCKWNPKHMSHIRHFKLLNKVCAAGKRCAQLFRSSTYKVCEPIVELTGPRNFDGLHRGRLYGFFNMFKNVKVK